MLHPMIPTALKPTKSFLSWLPVRSNTKLMRNAKLLLAIFTLLLAGCLVIPTYKARISVHTTAYNKQEVQVQNMMLVGTGPVASRVFLDNLHTEMTQSLKSKGVESRFSYAGSGSQYGPLKLDSLISDQYDAYLVFKATGPAQLNMTKPQYSAIGPGVVGTGYGNQYVENYTVSLYKGKEKLQLVWKGEMEVDFDLANDSRYKQISQLLLKELVDRHILPE